MAPKKAAGKKAAAKTVKAEKAEKPEAKDAPAKEQADAAPENTPAPATRSGDASAAGTPTEGVKTLDAEIAKAKEAAAAQEGGASQPDTAEPNAAAEPPSSATGDTTADGGAAATAADESAALASNEEPSNVTASDVKEDPATAEAPAATPVEDAQPSNSEKAPQDPAQKTAPEPAPAPAKEPSQESQPAGTAAEPPSSASSTSKLAEAPPPEGKQLPESHNAAAAAEAPADAAKPEKSASSGQLVRTSSKTKPAAGAKAKSPKPKPLVKEQLTPARQKVSKLRDSGDARYLADLGTVTTSSNSPLAHLLCHGPPKPAPAAADGSPRTQPPMRHAPPQDTRSPSPGPRNLQITVDPAAMERTLEEKKRAREMRKERRRREKEKLAVELAEAEQRAKEAALARDQERQRREEELRDRLEQLRERKAQRELEFLVSEKRAQQVRASKSLADVIQEQYDAKQRAEEEERQRLLQERREKMHAPVLTGLEAVQRHFQMVEERKARKEQELRERNEAIERSAPEPYHGSSYEGAVEDFVRFRHGEADARHQRLYKHAKMQEYGNLVKRLYGPKAHTPPPDLYSTTGSGMSAAQQHERNKSPPPFVTTGHGNATGVASPVQRKESLDPLSRNKAGNQYLREVLAGRPPPPPGLKVAPLERDPRDEEYKRLKERKKKGDQYLRQVRELPLKRSHSTPHPSRNEADEARAMEVRRLKAQTASLENRLHGQAVDLEDPEACVQSNEEYLEMVRLKLELLRKAPTRTEPAKPGPR